MAGANKSVKIRVPDTPTDCKIQVGSQTQLEPATKNVESSRKSLRRKLTLLLVLCFFALAFCAAMLFSLVVLHNQHNEIKNAFTHLSSQFTTLHKMNSIPEDLNTGILKNRTVFDHEKEFNHSSNNPNTEPTRSHSAPRFFLDEQYKEAYFEPAPGWQNGCVNMPSYMEKEASSIKLEGNCLLICPGRYCSKIQGTPCLEIHPNSYGLDNLVKIGYGNTIKSFRPCSNTTYSRLML